MNHTLFDEKASLYAASRPSYPKELFEFLTENRILTDEKTVADVGAGTGLFTSSLAAYAKRVFAVEPNHDMRCEAQSFLRGLSNVCVTDGSAESIPLADASVDCITVAQAFHWFDRDAFRKEARRVLRPDGTVVLVWNDRDETSELVRVSLMLNRTLPRFAGKSGGENVADEAGIAKFFTADFRFETFPNRQYYTESTFLARHLSSSFAPTKSEAEYDAYVASVRALFARFCDGDTVAYPYITRIYCGKIC